ncbi:hypothetical protein CK910_22270 [Aeromonas sp. CA23]|nr:hypothetical protein CK910_22270 [Aeromonas sp. CA23]
MVARGSVVLDIHLLQGYDRLGTILDAELAEGGSGYGPLLAAAQSSLISICCRAITAWVRFLTPSLRKAGVDMGLDGDKGVSRP